MKDREGETVSVQMLCAYNELSFKLTIRMNGWYAVD